MNGAVALQLGRRAPRGPLVLEWHKSTAKTSLAALTAALVERRAELQDRLLERGAALFRNVGLRMPEELTRLTEALSGKPAMAYVGGDSPRRSLGGHTYTSTDLPRDVTISLHNELSFRAVYPRYLLFYCMRAADFGGETLLADARTVYDAIDRSVRDEFESRRLRYVHTYPSRGALAHFVTRVGRVQRTWNEAFETDSRVRVEERCRALGMDPAWKGDTLVARCTRPASEVHWSTGERVWFNQAHIMAPSPRSSGWHRYVEARVLYLHPTLRSRAVTYADGEPIEPRALHHIHDVLDANTFRLTLHPGELLILDNMVAMHGRTPFRGSRKVLLAMGS